MAKNTDGITIAGPVDINCPNCGVDRSVKDIPIQITADGKIILVAKCPASGCTCELVETAEISDIPPESIRFFCTSCKRRVKVTDPSVEPADIQTSRMLRVSVGTMIATGNCELCHDENWEEVPRYVDDS